VGVNRKDVNQKRYSHHKEDVSAIDRSQPKGVKPKMREDGLRNGVNWQGALKQKGLKQEIGYLFAA